MVVHTRSELATGAQQSTMEFLLINHPLDCPICDQGGECELQDVAMGYGGSSSEYIETKRVVMDKNIGPLISTELTRCIHCTRCVRFGEEIAGVRELGATGRGENMRIGTYIEKSVDSELSGNVIDLCPVGALTAKPSRFSARSWELSQHASVAPHDSVGSNLFLHVGNGSVMRAVPRENESLNQTWLSDRDRFSYEGLNSADRATQPMVRSNGELQAVSWEVALQAAADAMQSCVEQHGAAQLGALASASATLEELYLMQQLVRSTGSENVDHRISQTDFSDQHLAPVMPWLGQSIAELETVDAALLIGSNIRKEQPLAALRLRMAALKGAQVSLINSRVYDMHFDCLAQLAGPGQQQLAHVAAVALAAGSDHGWVRDIAGNLEVSEQHRAIAQSLANGKAATVLLGNSSVMHANYAALRALASAIAEQTGARLGYLPESGNTAGAWLAGCLPHRGVAGNARDNVGLSAGQMLARPLKCMLLMGTEPGFEHPDSAQAQQTLKAVDNSIVITSHVSKVMLDHADVILPAACFAETAGTFVNASGNWQMFNGAVAPPGEARPGWKILRVLGNQLGADGFDYQSVDDIRAELKNHCRDLALDNRLSIDADLFADHSAAGGNGELIRNGDLPALRADMLVRRAGSLQRSADARQGVIALNASDLERLGLQDDAVVNVEQHGQTIVLKAVRDDGVPAGSAWLPLGGQDVAGFGALGAPLRVTGS
jgi:NADH-quinone oxidoreductase subunit G